ALRRLLGAPGLREPVALGLRQVVAAAGAGLQVVEAARLARLPGRLCRRTLRVPGLALLLALRLPGRGRLRAGLALLLATGIGGVAARLRLTIADRRIGPAQHVGGLPAARLGRTWGAAPRAAPAGWAGDRPGRCGLRGRRLFGLLALAAPAALL